MSVSKLESLPNEILADILEKYINGIDIVNAFAFQLNQRFDALITQSQRFRFNFIRCHKNDFRLCMGLLPVYIDKIEQLALAERYTPGQIHAFLSFYPSFYPFKRLRKLYLHSSTDAVELTILINAIQSLSTTSLHTLSLDITGSTTSLPLLYSIITMFGVKTLKKLLIVCNNCEIQWKELQEISSNIEHLTIHGITCYPADLVHIFRCAPGLRYFRTDISFRRYYHTIQPKLSPTNSPPQMSMLHTVVFYLRGNTQKNNEQLETYFRCMTSLRHLEIKRNNVFCNINAWKTLIQTTLPSLTSFTLESTISNLTENSISSILTSTDTSLWNTKNQFHVIIKDLKSSSSSRFHSEDSDNFDRDQHFEIINRWCITPRHNMEKNSSVLNKISNLHLSSQSHSLLENYYLDNVIHLNLAELDDNILQLLINHINCYRIKFLDVSSIKKENNLIFSLLSFIPNIQSLRIRSNQLCNKQLDHLKQYHNIRFLDTSIREHRFTEQNISTISKIFPRLEHLIIDTNDLQNIPILQTYLPHLYSLTYYAFTLDSNPFSDYKVKMFDHTLRKNTNFLFQRKGKWITIWIDEMVLNNTYWSIINRFRSSRYVSDDSNTDTDTDTDTDTNNTVDDSSDME